MDRKSIKAEAKEKIKGKKWQILWPLLLIGFVSGFLSAILQKVCGVEVVSYETMLNGVEANVVGTNTSLIYSILSSLLSIATTVFTFAYFKYLINIVRTGEAHFKDIVDCAKEKWLTIILASLLVGVIVFAFSLLLVVPGIIRAISYSFVSLLIVDTDLQAKAALKKSRAMLKGYKWDYFVFMLSFIGWFILAPFTLFILLIWLFPYVMVSEVLYYDKLKEING